MTAYKEYPNTDVIKNWEKLLSMSLEEVEALQKEWEVIEKENQQIGKDNLEERTKRTDEMVKVMLKQNIEVRKFKRNFTPNGYVPWFKKNIVDVIQANYPANSTSLPSVYMDKQVVHGVELSNNLSPINIVECYKRLSHRFEEEKRKSEKKNKLLVASIKYATEHQIDIEGLSSQEIVQTVDEEAKEAFLKEELPNGTEVELKNECDECETYIMGEYRCDCGNSRISITVEGDILEGFYYYPERC
ncbi:hypothetical protein [Rossellomorea marisflavi]|uniref:hypothetical protein n=1 Tax=Rossellomorea marisflavi TaxID=189381 RepID=UPI003FA12C10